LKPLIADGANPVVFCRFIATADHVATGLKKAFPKLRIEIVTGALTSEDRRERVESMSDSEQRLLVATDCLSEGVNLQALFDAVIHYDLSWNPTRHQQREGRVDRFGQPLELVRSVLLYSPDSAIDGAVLDVILRKAEAIRKATGVTVPLPEEKAAVSGALLNAVLLRKGRTQQLSLDLGIAEDAKCTETAWRDAEEGEKRSRARFAQNALKPAEVAPEWRKWRDLLGTPAEVQRFTTRAMSRLDAPLEDVAKTKILRAHIGSLPPAVKERLDARGLHESIRINFEELAPAGVQLVGRCHPLTSTLAEALLEGALDAGGTMPKLGRAGAWQTSGVNELTTILLLRIRHKLLVRGRRERLLLAEEAGALALSADSRKPVLAGEAARALLEQKASGNLSDVARDRLVAQARKRVEALLDGPIAEYGRSRAAELSNDHSRVRAAITGAPRVEVEPVLPVDVIGLYVLVPPA
jgi:hypothetical protein